MYLIAIIKDKWWEWWWLHGGGDDDDCRRRNAQLCGAIPFPQQNHVEIYFSDRRRKDDDGALSASTLI